MPKLERWIIASKMVPVLDHETLMQVVSLGGSIGGGWSQIHQHINVNAENKEKIEELLQSRGYEVSNVSDRRLQHPEIECMTHKQPHREGEK